MSLVDIENKVIGDAKSRAADIKTEAKLAAKKLLDEQAKGLLAREKISGEMIRVEAEEEEIKLVSPVRIRAKNETLAKKEALVGSLYASALKELEGIGEKKYRNAIICLLRSLGDSPEGEILPASGRTTETKSALESYIKENKGASGLKMGKCAKDISGGFIFKGAAFDLDCSFGSIMKEIRESTAVRVARKLFQVRK